MRGQHSCLYVYGLLAWGVITPTIFLPAVVALRMHTHCNQNYPEKLHALTLPAGVVGGLVLPEVCSLLP